MAISSKYPTFSALLTSKYGPISSSSRRQFYIAVEKQLYLDRFKLANGIWKHRFFIYLLKLTEPWKNAKKLAEHLLVAKHLDQDKNWMIGLYGRVTSPICGTGTIWLLDRIWDAKSHSSLSTIETGMEVIIKGFSPPLYLTVSTTGRRLLS